MKTCCGLAVLVLLAAGRPAVADIGPPPGFKAVPVTTVVEAAEPLPDYTFFTHTTGTFFGGPPPEPGQSAEPPGWRTEAAVTAVNITPGQPFRFTGERRSGGTLYAVPKAAAGERDLKGLAKDVEAGKVPGSARIPLQSVREIPIADPRTELVVRYRVRKDKVGVMFTRADEPGEGEPVRGGGGSSDGSGSGGVIRVPGRWVVAGLAIATAVVLAGLLLVWRFQRRSEA